MNLSFQKSAVWTGLEPATPCVTGMYSNQLNYQTDSFHKRFCKTWCKTTINIYDCNTLQSNLVILFVKR